MHNPIGVKLGPGTTPAEAVEMCEIWSATPADWMAFSESPPPTTEVAPEAVPEAATSRRARTRSGPCQLPSAAGPLVHGQ